MCCVDNCTWRLLLSPKNRAKSNNAVLVRRHLGQRTPITSQRRRRVALDTLPLLWKWTSRISWSPLHLLWSTPLSCVFNFCTYLDLLTTPSFHFYVDFLSFGHLGYRKSHWIWLMVLLPVLGIQRAVFVKCCCWRVLGSIQQSGFAQWEHRPFKYAQRRVLSMFLSQWGVPSVVAIIFWALRLIKGAKASNILVSIMVIGT
jgi:hypothetical protein